RHRQASVSLSVGTPSASHEPITFEALSADYLREHSANVKESSLVQMGYEYKTIAETLNGLDLKTHTREDMVNLREALKQKRAASTVNNLLSKLSTVMEWAVNNQLIPYARTKDLKIKRGAESKREAFTQAEVQAIMDKAASLQEDNWLRWALSLGAITGARVGELLHLTQRDIREQGGIVFIDINEADGKELKNGYSARWVPLTDRAYGSFNLSAFMRYVESHKKRNALGVSHTYAKKVLNQTVQEVAECTNGTLTFHSLRHSIASHLKSKGAPLETVQAITGHSSGSITFDHYGAGGRVELGIMAEALRNALVP
ncbi:tyrosine-type recombinase/integrase, partial [uncultured Pseudomonas sp.]|uniref:tyrosine-type recombinase/integrase n=1 Tax=uncultured Pseudomonas sp. TaxID=114707 RepID=UPI00258C715A